METPKRFLLYQKEISEQLKLVANKYGLRVIFTRSLSIKSKSRSNLFESNKVCGVVYKETCFCCRKYFGETGTKIQESINKHQAHTNNENSAEKSIYVSQHLRESRHTPNCKEVELLLKENNAVKRKFKESVTISNEKKDNLLNKKEKRKVPSDIWGTKIPRTKVN